MRCCQVFCDVCAEPMVEMDEKEEARALLSLEEKVGDPLYPQDLKTQCKLCGRRTELHMVTDYGVGGLTLGMCKDCFEEQKG